MSRSRSIFLLGLGLGLLVVLASRFRCIVESTTIATPLGDRAIEDLRVGDLVWSLDAHGRPSTSTVTAVEWSYSLRHLRFGFDNGEQLEVTPSHPMASEDGWTEAGRVSSGALMEGRFGALVVTGVESEISWKTVYDLTVEPHANFYANGVLVHNKSVYAPERQAIGDARTIVSALTTYSSANCGLYPRDLTHATRDDGTPMAIPDYPEEAPDFLGADLGRPSPYVKYGYRRTYQTFDPPEEIPPECAAGSVRIYCYASRPVQPYRAAWLNDHPWLANLVGFDSLRYRSFVATSDGHIYADRKGRDLSCIEGKPPDFAVQLE